MVSLVCSRCWIRRDRRSTRRYGISGYGEFGSAVRGVSADFGFSDGEGFLIVYSVASRDTFDRVESILRRVRRVKEDAASLTSQPYQSASPTTPSSQTHRPPPLPIVIIGNKSDLPHGREVMPEEGARLAQRLGCEFYETSAKTGWNVDNAFKSVVRGIRASKGLSGGVSPIGGGNGPGMAQGTGNQAGVHAAGGNGYPERKRKEKRHKRCTIL